MCVFSLASLSVAAAARLLVNRRCTAAVQEEMREKLVSGHSSCGYLSSAQSVVGICGPDIAHGQSGGLWRHAVRNLEGPD